MRQGATPLIRMQARGSAKKVKHRKLICCGAGKRLGEPAELPRLHGQGVIQLCCSRRPPLSSAKVPSSDPPRLHRHGPAGSSSTDPTPGSQVGPGIFTFEVSSPCRRTHGHCMCLWLTPGLSSHPPHRRVQD